MFAEDKHSNESNFINKTAKMSETSSLRFRKRLENQPDNSAIKQQRLPSIQILGYLFGQFSQVENYLVTKP